MFLSWAAPIAAIVISLASFVASEALKRRDYRWAERKVAEDRRRFEEMESE